MSKLFIQITFVLFFLNGCKSTSVEELTLGKPAVWVEKNSNTGWNDLIIRTSQGQVVDVINSKFKILSPIFTKDEEIVAYISFENKQVPYLYIQNIYLAKREKMEPITGNNISIKFIDNEQSILVSSDSSSKTISIAGLLR